LLPPQAKKRFTKRDGSKVAKLAILAGNAVRNGDLHRAMELLEEIRTVGDGHAANLHDLRPDRRLPWKRSGKGAVFQSR
jgi:hypothetical protein